MIADYGDGGQKMLDIMAFNKSLKIAWIVKYIYISDDCKSTWHQGGLPSKTYRNLGGL